MDAAERRFSCFHNGKNGLRREDSFESKSQRVKHGATEMGSFADDGGDELTFSSVVAVFAEVDSLPDAEIEVAVGDGDGDAHAAEDGLGMGGHIVGAFEGVLVAGLVFGDEAIEDGFHIDAHIGVAVFVDGESATGVFGEEVEDASLGQSGQLAEYFSCDQMEASRLGAECEFFLLYHFGDVALISPQI